MAITDEIRYKLSFIESKERSGAMLSHGERTYSRNVSEFLKYYDNAVLNKELEYIAAYERLVVEYLDKREEEITSDLSKTRSLKKCAAMQNALECIKWLKEDGLRLFFYYVMDNYPQNNKDLGYFLSINSQSNQSISEDSTYLYKYGNLYNIDPISHEVSFNSSLLNLIKNYIDGNYELFNKVEKIYRLAEKKPEEARSLMKALPQELRDIDIPSLKKFVKYISNDSSRDIKVLEDRVVLDFFQAFDDLNNDVFEANHQAEIFEYMQNKIEDLFANRVRIRDLEKRRVLDYFMDRENLSNCRKIFKQFDYDFDSIIKYIMQEDLIAKTRFNQSGSDFYDEHGFCLPNINLACDYLSGSAKNYKKIQKYDKDKDVSMLEDVPDNLIGADSRCLERIAYYGKGKITNPDNHEFDDFKLALEMLQTIGNYYNGVLAKKDIIELPKIAM